MEILSVLLTPLVLSFSLPNCVPEMLAFISRHTAYVDGVGDVCDYSTFDFDAYGNSEFLSPTDGTSSQADMRSNHLGSKKAEAYEGNSAYRRMTNDLIAQKDRISDGKLEQSYMSFRLANPEWEGSVGGATSTAPTHVTSRDKLYTRPNPLFAGMRAPGDNNVSPVRDREYVTAGTGTSNSSRLSESQMSSAAGGALLDRIRQYRYHMTGGNDTIENVASSIISKGLTHKPAPSIRNVFNGSNDSASFADHGMPPLHPRNNVIRVENNENEQVRTNGKEITSTATMPEPLSLRNVKNQSSRESVVSSVVEQSSSGGHSKGDTDTSDVEDHVPPSAPRHNSAEYSLTTEELERHTQLFGDEPGGESMSNSQIETYADVIDRRGIEQYIDASVEDNKSGSSNEYGLQSSIASILRSALRGEEGESYDNDFYWLNKYRSERVRQSVGSSGSTGSFHSATGSILGSDQSQYSSPRSSGVFSHGSQSRHPNRRDMLGHLAPLAHHYQRGAYQVRGMPQSPARYAGAAGAENAGTSTYRKRQTIENMLTKDVSKDNSRIASSAALLPDDEMASV